MNSIYLPLDVFTALMNNPNISIKEIEALANVAYPTAARYKSNYNKCCKKLIKIHHIKRGIGFGVYRKENEQYKKLINVHHIKREINIGVYRKGNEQDEKLKIFLDYLLNNEGFDSTRTLRSKFYKENPEFKNQKNRNFNRYFSEYRKSEELKTYKLKICKSSENLIGFCTRSNPDFKPTDN